MSPRASDAPYRKRSSMHYLAEPPGISKPAWILAMVTVALLHLCIGTLFYARYHPEVSAPELGAQAIEIDIEMTAPRKAPDDLPPGAEANDSAASAAQAERQMRTKNVALPKDTPVETSDATRRVAPDVAERPKEETEKLVSQSRASAPSVASAAAAPPVMKTITEARRSTAPALGNGDSARRVRASWQRELVAYLNRHKRYPPGASGRDAEIVVAFTLDRTGQILSEHIVKGTNAPLFNRAALDMIRRSSPVPPPPPLIASDVMSFTLPVLFEPRERR